MNHAGITMIPLSTEYAIREAVALLRASQKHFKSRDVAQARELLEECLEGLPERKIVGARRRAHHIDPPTEIDADPYA